MFNRYRDFGGILLWVVLAARREEFLTNIFLPHISEKNFALFFVVFYIVL